MNKKKRDFLWDLAGLQSDFTAKVIELCEQYDEDIIMALRGATFSFTAMLLELEDGDLK